MARLQMPAGGFQRIDMRPWEYLFTFRLCAPIQNPGIPTMASQLNPGINGSLWFDPVPDADYTVSLDAVQWPADLSDPLLDQDTVLPQPWTEAVQYYAAYLAYLNAQRYSDANSMWDRYQLFEWRGTQTTTPSRLPQQYPGGRAAQLASQNVPLTGQPGGGRAR
jgi:hypothetical protein